MKFFNTKQIRLAGGIIWLLEKMYGAKTLDPKLAHLRTLEKGTVGREVAELLDSNGYRLIPKFEDHDLKHVILNYKMTMEDEIRMQAYLIGNGNYSFPCLAFLALGVFYPSVWSNIPKEYSNGRKRKPIHLLTLDTCKDKKLAMLKNEYGRS